MNQIRTWKVLREFFTVVPVLFFLLLLTAPIATAKVLYVSYDSKSTINQQYLTRVQLNLASVDIVWKVFDYRDFSSQSITSKSDDALLLTIGTMAAQKSKGLTREIPVLHTLISRSAYDYVSSVSEKDLSRGAVFLDQPLERMLNLTKILQRNSRAVSLLLSEGGLYQKPALLSQSKKAGIELHIEVLDKDNPSFSIKNVVVQNVPVIAVPDSKVFTATNVKMLLYLSYQHKVPIIGYSESFVSAGALAAIYSDIDSLTLQSAEVIEHWYTGATKDYMEARYPRTFSVSVNTNVARAFGMGGFSIKSLEQRLLEMEASK